MKTKPYLVLSILLIGLLCIPAYAGQMKHADKDGHAKHKAMMEDSKSAEQMNVDVQLHDLELVNQDGKRVKFKSDVIGDKLVAINFIYTSCTTICPIYNAIFTQLQELLGERQGEEVILISLSIDPARDIPPRMKKEAEKFKAKPGWTYLTGKKGTVDEVLRGLDAFYPDYTQHPPMALVGDGKTGTWKRYFGFPPPDGLQRRNEPLWRFIQVQRF
jgi:protein SCO1/2